MQGDNISTVGDNISTVEGIQYCGGMPSVLWGITAVHVGGLLQYCGGFASVLWRVFSTLGDNISTCRGITSVHWGITSVLWRVFSTVGEEFSFRHVWSLIMTKRYRPFRITIRNFHSEIFRKFKQISCIFRAGLVYSRSNLVSK